MTEGRWAQVKALFEAAVDRPASERAAFLRAAAGGDQRLCRDVESLLRADDPDAALTNLLQQQDARPPSGSIDTNDSASDETRTQTAADRTTIGPYRVVGLLGAGGMGEVFRARDDKLHRDVALKLLPTAFAFDPDRLARFRREARALAALNHPHIGAIYGLEESDGRQALVLELVDGVTLAERIARGPLPVREALTLARQIAGALEAAHEKGIVHRDLKPANVKVTPAGIVKVLDFGLAKTAAGEPAARDVVNSSLTADGSTRVGAVLGTAAYMSPEQARGLEVDTRTDIWAFGCVLFEMMSGRKAFGADANSDSTEKVLAREPDWTALPPRTPVKVRGLLRRCLEKDPARRLRTIADAHRLVDRMLKGGSLARRAAGAAIAAAVLATAASVYVWNQPRQTNRSDWVPLTHFADSATQPAISPDGDMLAFIRGPDSRLRGPGQIYIKPLPDGESVPLTDDNARKMSPVFSPDGSRIAYTASPSEETWDTWVVPVVRGAPSPWLKNASGLTWHGQRGEILFSEYKTQPGPMGIVTSAERRSDPRFLYVPTPPADMAHRSYRSPDGEWVLLAEMNGPGDFLPCRLLPFDGSSTGRTVGPPASICAYAAWSPDGRWMYFSAAVPGDGSHLWRQRFPDGAVEQLTSGPTTTEEGLAVHPDGRSLITSVGVRQTSVWLHDATGERQISLEGNASHPILSADEKKVYYRVRKALDQAKGFELHVTDVKSRRTEHLFPGERITGFDLSPDDDRIVAAVVERDGSEQLWLASLDGRTAPRRIPGAGGVVPRGLEPRFGRPGEIIYRAGEKGVLRVKEDGSGSQQLTPRAVRLGRTSPDGQWISGMRGVGSAPPIWLFSLTGADPLLFLQKKGGGGLRWAADGSHLYVLRWNDRRTYVVPLAKGKMLPPMPSGGFRTEEEIAALPGVKELPLGDVGPGPSPGVYVFSRQTGTRNIYRIPLP